jgi:putative oxidoreductase
MAMSTGLLVIRVVVGLLMTGHGLQKLFGWFGGPGMARTAAGFEMLGFKPSKPMAWMAALGELGSGLSIATGFLTPLGSASLIGVMFNAGAVHWPNGLWIQKKGYEYTLALAALGAGLAFTGPGRYSLDHLLGIDDELTTTGWALAAIAAGAAGGGLTLVRQRRTLKREGRTAPAP